MAAGKGHYRREPIAVAANGILDRGQRRELAPLQFLVTYPIGVQVVGDFFDFFEYPLLLSRFSQNLRHEIAIAGVDTAAEARQRRGIGSSHDLTHHPAYPIFEYRRQNQQTSGSGNIPSVVGRPSHGQQGFVKRSGYLDLQGFTGRKTNRRSNDGMWWIERNARKIGSDERDHGIAIKLTHYRKLQLPRQQGSLQPLPQIGILGVLDLAPGHQTKVAVATG